MSSDFHTQMSLYLPVDLRNELKAEMFRRGLQFSDVAEELFRAWLQPAAKSSRKLNTA